MTVTTGLFDGQAMALFTGSFHSSSIVITLTPAGWPGVQDDAAGLARTTARPDGSRGCSFAVSGLGQPAADRRLVFVGMRRNGVNGMLRHGQGYQGPALSRYGLGPAQRECRHLKRRTKTSFHSDR